MGDDELEELRRRRIREMQERAGPEEQMAANQEFEAQKQNALRVILTPEARDRLTRVRLARPEVAERLEQQLLALYQQGRIRGQISDEIVREFLARLTPKSRDIKIERK